MLDSLFDLKLILISLSIKHEYSDKIEEWVLKEKKGDTTKNSTRILEMHKEYYYIQRSVKFKVLSCTQFLLFWYMGISYIHESCCPREISPGAFKRDYF